MHKLSYSSADMKIRALGTSDTNKLVSVLLLLHDALQKHLHSVLLHNCPTIVEDEYEII